MLYTCILIFKPISHKKLILLSICAFLFTNAFSQNTFPNTGPVGIGTLNPQAELHVNGSAIISGSILTSQVLIANKVQTDTLKGATLKLGSGIALPSEKLFCTGDATVTGKLKVGNSITIDGINNHIQTDEGTLYLQSTSAIPEGGDFKTAINVFNEFGVGIGTDNPLKKLQVTANHFVAVLPPPDEVPSPMSHDGIRLENIFRQASNPSVVLGTNTWDIEPSGSNNLTFHEPGQPSVLTLLDFGRAIIGTVVPVSSSTYDAPSRLKLDVRGDGRFTDATGNNYLRVGYNGANAIMDNFGTGGLLINYYSNKDVVIGNSTSPIKANLKVAGNVAVGTIIDPNFKITVNGRIRAKEVVVETGWNDWVLKPGYELQSLDDRRNSIFSNFRMPYMQSEADVKENGAKVGANLSGLQHNVEDIYLYIFQLNDKIEKSEKEKEELKSKLAALEEKLNQIEKE